MTQRLNDVDKSAINPVEGNEAIHSNYLITVPVMLAVIVGLYFLSRFNYPLFHSLADGATVFIATGVFVVVWNRRHLLDNQFYLFVGIAFLFFAFWDALHLLGNRGMGVFPQYGNLGPGLYVISRYFLGISMLIAPLFIKRKLNTALTFSAYVLVTALLVLSVFYWQNFPVAYIEGVGLTSFKVISDYVVCLFLAGALGLLYINRRLLDAKVFRFFISALIFFIATGLAFTLYTDPFGVTNSVGHFFQIVSFYLVYVALLETIMVKPQDILYRSLKQSEENAHELNTDLENVNVRLIKEITERQKVEEELRHYTSELEAANKELEAFSYSVSHDLRAPLRTLDGFSGILLEDYGDKLDETGKDHIQRIRNASQTMSRLIDDILKLSRISRAEMHQDQVDLSDLAKSIMEVLKQTQPERKAEIIIAPNLIVNGDAALLRVALNNLLENAWKYTSKGEQTRIEFGKMGLQGEQVFFIRDNGIGFDIQYADKLFQPFQRLHTSKDYAGTGIGLATVQRVIHRHGGRIWAESEVGKGTTFYFTLE